MSLLKQKIIDRQRRTLHAGEIRIADVKGEKFPGRPLDNFRLTSLNRASLCAAALVYGGEVVPWTSDGKPKGYQLFTERSQIKAFFSTHEKDDGDLESLSLTRDLWAGDSHVRECDGITCLTWVDTGDKKKVRGQEVSVMERQPCPCLCAQGKGHGSKNQMCAERARSSFILTEFPTLGLWHFMTGSQTFTDEVLGLLDQIQMLGMMGQLIPVTLTISKRTKRTAPGQDNEFFPVVKIEIDPQPVSLPQLLAGVRAQALAMPANTYGETVALPQSAPQLPKPSPNGLSDEQKAEAADYVRSLGMVKSVLEKIKQDVVNAGLLFTVLALEAKAAGIDEAIAFSDFIDSKIPAESVQGVLVEDEE